MVQEFEVKVTAKSVQIWHATGLKKYHFAAVVDGEDYHYQIVNEKGSLLVKSEAFGRASVEVHYHAKNAGNVVRFKPVNNKSPKRKKPISEKQGSLF